MQGKLESLVEQLLNVGSGFVVALIVWTYMVTPIWDIEVTMLDNLAITGLFTVVSVVRGYVWRRMFNRRAVRRYSECPHHG